jgi:hypothetical protein
VPRSILYANRHSPPPHSVSSLQTNQAPGLEHCPVHTEDLSTYGRHSHCNANAKALWPDESLVMFIASSTTPAI